MNQIKTEQKGKTPYTENHIHIKTYVPSGWCLYSTFAYGDALDPLKMYFRKYCVEKFVEHVKY